MGTVPTSSCSTMRWVLVLTCIGMVVPSPVPSPQLEGLKVLLESLSGDDKPGETNGDYQEVPYDTIEKLNGYEERKYPSVKWACTEATYQVEEQEDDATEEWSMIKMMQMMTNKKSWKKKPENKMFMKLFRYIAGVNKERQEIDMTVPVLSRMVPLGDGKMNKQMCFYLTKEVQDNPPQPEDPDVKIEQKKEMVVFVKQFGGYAMQDSTWLKQAADFSEQLTEDRANEVDLDKFYTSGTTTSSIMPKKANIFDSFSHSAIQQFKEAFGIMDADKDGLLSSSDLVAAFGAYGKNIGGGEAQAMLDEVDGPMNFTQMVTLFASKMAGGSDDDDVILASFEAFEMDGKIDADAFRHSLMTFGVKFSASEVDDAFAEMKIDEGMIDAAHLKGLMVSK